jgi:cell division protein FtsB
MNNYSAPKKILIMGLSFLFLVLIIASFFGEKGLIEIFHAQKENDAMKQEVQQLSRKRDKLIRDIWELENNPKAVELKAREKLWLSDPDEIIIIKK